MVDRQSDMDRADTPKRREPIFNLPMVVVVFIAVCAVLELVQAFVLTNGQALALSLRGAFIPVRYTGEFPLDIWTFTTPFTYSLLHAGFIHLIVNMLWLAAFGSPLANRFGALRFFMFWVLTSVAAAFLHFLLHSGELVPLVGASGAVSGMMGAAARYGFRIDRSAGRPLFLHAPMSVLETLRNRGVLTFLAIWFAVNLVAGFGWLTPGMEGTIAWEAHVGGFLAGFFFAPLFDNARASSIA